jgi:hypothetical protein
MREAAATHAESGSLMSMADARFIVLNIFHEEQAAWPSPDILEKLASKQVQLTLQAHDLYRAGLRHRKAG